jgi:hypothetical protein
MGAGLQRAFAATAVTRLTDQQRSVVAVMSDEWMTADQIAQAAGIGGFSPRETAARIANRLARDFVIDKGGTRMAPTWRRTRRMHG